MERKNYIPFLVIFQRLIVKRSKNHLRCFSLSIPHDVSFPPSFTDREASRAWEVCRRGSLRARALPSWGTGCYARLFSESRAGTPAFPSGLPFRGALLGPTPGLKPPPSGFGPPPVPTLLKSALFTLLVSNQKCDTCTRVARRFFPVFPPVFYFV